MPVPSGTVTFLFTDIEGSTRLLQDLGDRYAGVLADHHRLLRSAFGAQGGTEVQDHGDGLYYTFPSARAAVLGAVDGQRAIAAHPWPVGVGVRVRMGLHTGEFIRAETGLVGLDVHRAARICATGWGGQILISQTTRDLVADSLPDGLGLRDLGNRRLKDLASPQHLYQAIADGLPTDFPPLKSLDVLPTNLPVQLTSFIGREREMAEVSRLLTTTRLLTLTGVGGCGKTRLALQVAADLLNAFEDGVWLVELAPLTDPALVPQTVATQLKLADAGLGDPEEGAGPVRRPPVAVLQDYLQPKALLLILDNCEHLVSACAALAEALLRSCQRLRVLATSREPLGIAGEATFPVPPLSLADPRHLPPLERLRDFEAVHLFADRAAAATPAFVVTAQNATAVAQVCQGLDGLPLAIELAAARVRAFTVEELARRLADRFLLLTGGSRTALPRQQTLQATLDWSYDLLSERERMLLRRLAVFAGGFTLEAAGAVCSSDEVTRDEVLNMLTRLVEKSLVQAEAQDGQMRYRLLEIVRQYAHNRLMEACEDPVVRARHLDWCLTVAAQYQRELTGRHPAAWYGRIRMEHDNFRAALAWSLEQIDAEPALHLAGSLGWFWHSQGHAIEGREWLERALSRTNRRTPERSEALCWAAPLSLDVGDTDRAASLAEECLGLSRGIGATSHEAWAFNILGDLAIRRGDHVAAAAYYTHSLRRFREIGSERSIAIALRDLGVAAHVRGDYGAARALFEESLALATKVGTPQVQAQALLGLGMLAQAEGSYESAGTLLRKSEAVWRVLGNKPRLCFVLMQLAPQLAVQGDFGPAIVAGEEAVSLARELRYARYLIMSLRVLARVAVDQGDLVRATALCEEGLRVAEERNYEWGAALTRQTLATVLFHQGEHARATTLLDESLEVLERPRARDMQVGSRDPQAASLIVRAGIAHHLHDCQRAVDLARDALRRFRQTSSKVGFCRCFETLGMAAEAQGQPDRAARLFGAAEALRAALGAPLPPVERTDFGRSLAALRLALPEEVVAAAWAAGRAMTLEDAVAFALS